MKPPHMPPPTRHLYVPLTVQEADELLHSLRVAQNDAETLTAANENTIVVLDVEWRETSSDVRGHTRLTPAAVPANWRP